MIHLFVEMFGPEFWSQTALVFTRLSMDSKEIKKRQRNTEKTDYEKASSYLKHLETKFPEGHGLKYLLLDAWHDDEDEVEKKAFDQGMHDLWTMIASAPNLPTDKMKAAETKYKKLEKTVEVISGRTASK